MKKKRHMMIHLTSIVSSIFRKPPPVLVAGSEVGLTEPIGERGTMDKTGCQSSG